MKWAAVFWSAELMDLDEEAENINLFEEILELFLKFVYLILFIVVNIYI